MKTITKFSLLLLTTLILSSCGSKDETTSSKISIISGLSSVTAQYSGGVALFARNKDTGSVLSKNINTEDLEIQFDNGNYEFLIMAWDGSTQMTGTAFCDGKDDVTLDGTDVTLNFTLQSASCDTLESKSGPLYFYSNPMSGKVPGIQGDYSVKLYLYEFDGVPVIDNQNIPAGVIGTTCLVKDSINDSLNLGTTSPFPTLDIPMIAEVFDGKNDCSGEPTRKYLLPTGLDENDPEYLVFSVNIPLDDLVMVVETSSTPDIVLPFNGVFDVEIDWGDGETSSVTNLDVSGLSHTYPGTSEYIIRVSGASQEFNCYTASCDSLTHVLNLGDLHYTNLDSAFRGAYYLVSFSGGETSSVTDMSDMFQNATSLSRLDLSSFDTTLVTDMSGMFFYTTLLSSVDLSNFDTSSVTTMNKMFYYATALSYLDLSFLDTSSVTDMSEMFSNANSLFSLNIGGLDTSSVTNMMSMFNGASSLTTLDLSGLDTSAVTSMTSMFYGASSLTTLDLSSLDTSKVTSMASMFKNASSLTSLNLSGLDTSLVTNMNYMFYNATGLTSVDATGWDITSSPTYADIFSLTSFTLACNDQDTTPDGSGAPSTGYLFGVTCI